jgi:nucleotide sugar dehydrogenase
MRICVVGLGYVGLPLAVRAAEVGHHVVGVDLDRTKINSLTSGTSYIEDVSDQRLQQVRASARLGVCHQMLSSHGTFDLAVVTVPTPLKDGNPDLSYVISAAEDLGRILQPGSTIVLESTTYPGTTEGVFADAIERTSGLKAGVDFHLGFSPERIDPGPSSPHTLENTPKLVSGTTEKALEIIQGFYDDIVDVTVPVSSPKVAELAKVFENTQAYVNIALVNELAQICHDLDIDVHEMIEAAMTKGHSIARWTPGPGVGGHCLPIDPMYLAWQTTAQLGRPFKFAELADEINGGRPAYVVERAVDMLRKDDIDIRGTKVLVVGLAYKPNVGDLRESPALPVVEGLVARGADVTVVDPHVDEWSLTKRLSVRDLGAELSQFPLTIVVTHHDAIDYDKLCVEAERVLDCRNVVPARENVVRL